jgi:hypothetical protein
LKIEPFENRMFVQPDPAFYPRPDLAAELPNDTSDIELGAAVRAAAQALLTPLWVSAQLSRSIEAAAPWP